MYSKKAFDSDKAVNFLQLYVKQHAHLFDSEKGLLPDEEDFFETSTRVKDSAAWPDGIFYSAYTACPQLPSEVLVHCVSDLAIEQPARDLVSLNVQLVWVARKGIALSDVL